MSDQPTSDQQFSPDSFTSHLTTLAAAVETLLSQAQNLNELAEMATTPDNDLGSAIADLNMAIAHLESAQTWLKTAAKNSGQRVTAQDFQDDASKEVS